MSVVYKIYCKDPNITDCYIGSTKDLTNRKSQHICYCNNINSRLYNVKVYKFIRENGNFENWDFEILETFNTIDKQDLLKIERNYIESNKSTLNDRIPTRTKEEYNEFYKDYFKKNSQEYYKKEYYLNNKETIQEKKNEKIKCECGCMTTKSNNTRHRKSKKHIELMANK